MDLRRIILQTKGGGKIFRIPVTSGGCSSDRLPITGASGGVTPDAKKGVMSCEWGPAPRHRIVASGDGDGVRWAHFEPIP